MSRTNAFCQISLKICHANLQNRNVGPFYLALPLVNLCFRSPSRNLVLKYTRRSHGGNLSLRELELRMASSRDGVAASWFRNLEEGKCGFPHSKLKFSVRRRRRFQISQTRKILPPGGCVCTLHDNLGLATLFLKKGKKM